MNKRIAAVVASSKKLTNHEKIGAFLEIEEIWKALQAEPMAARYDPLRH